MRLLVAVCPPPAVVAHLATMDRSPRPGIGWPTDNQWHVTLRFGGLIRS